MPFSKLPNSFKGSLWWLICRSSIIHSIPVKQAQEAAEPQLSCDRHAPAALCRSGCTALLSLNVKDSP